MPNTLTPVTRYTRNITREFRTASQEARAEGMRWYADARAEAEAMAEATGMEVERTAAIVAVLSPMLSWTRNVKVAWMVCQEGDATGVLRTSLSKAQRLVAGEPVEAVVGGQKVTAFYRNILSAGMDENVTVDRHAIDVAYGIRHTETTRPDPGKAAYALISEAYTRAARILSRETGEPVTPAQIQAVTWTTWRARHAWR